MTTSHTNAAEFMETKRPLKVCLVSTEIVGPFRNGGVATANTGLVQFLRSLGHEITVLYCNVWENQPYVSDLTFDHWSEYYRKQGITLLSLHIPEYVKVTSLHRARSFAVNLFLEEGQFDLVFTDDLYGLCFYPLQMKRAGIAFRRTNFVLTVHSPHIWLATLNATPYENLEYLLLVDQEIYCIEHADYVIGPSEYLLKWLQDRGVRLPERTLVQQYVLPHEVYRGVDRSGSAAESAAKRVDEIVFFGRLETRKGIVLFCDLVDRLSQEFPNIKIAFLGKYDTVLGEHAGSYIARRSVKWPNPVRILTDYNTPEALKYLLGGKRLAVMPSLEDNLPCAVMECILNGVSFVTTGSGGIQELIATGDRESCVAGLSPDRLAELCVRAIESGSKSPRFAMQQDEIRERLTKFIGTLSDEIASGPSDATNGVRGASAPLVSVCVTHFNQGWYLPQQLEAVANQTYQNIEVIVVDDGSTDAFAQASFTRMESKYAPLGWKFIRQANAYLGAARNAAAREATGKYLIFMDDDNVALSHQIETFVAAAEHTGADIISCVSYMTFDVVTPCLEDCFVDYYPMGGASRAGGLAANVFADANSLFKRDAFHTLGGFSEKRGFACQDWKVFAAAKLAGMTHLVIPRPLFIYRRRWGGMFMRSDDVESRREILKVYASQKLGEVGGMIELLNGEKSKERSGFVLREYLNTLEHGEKLIELSLLPFDSRNSPTAHKLLFEYLLLHDRLDSAMQYATDHKIDSGYAVAAIRENAWSAHIQTGGFDSEETAKGDSDEYVPIPVQVLQSAIPCSIAGGRSETLARVPGGIVVRPVDGQPSRILLPRACPPGAVGLVIDVETDGAGRALAEVGLLLLDPDMRDVAFHDASFAKASAAANWSGRQKMNGQAGKWSVGVTNHPCDRPKDVILSIRTPAPKPENASGLVFSSLRVLKEGARSRGRTHASGNCTRQVLRLPRQVIERFKLLNPDTGELTKVSLDEKGMRLSPGNSEWSLAVCRRAVPAASAHVVAAVSLEHASASPVEFALWIGKLEDVELSAELNMQWVHGARGWSGWKRIDERLRQYRLQAKLDAQSEVEAPLDLFIAARSVAGESRLHLEPYFRGFEVEVQGTID